MLKLFKIEINKKTQQDLNILEIDIGSFLPQHY